MPPSQWNMAVGWKKRGGWLTATWNALSSRRSLKFCGSNSSENYPYWYQLIPQSINQWTQKKQNWRYWVLCKGRGNDMVLCSISGWGFRCHYFQVLMNVYHVHTFCWDVGVWREKELLSRSWLLVERQRYENKFLYYTQRAGIGREPTYNIHTKPNQN